jgi:hypothetical protein
VDKTNKKPTQERFIKGLSVQNPHFSPGKNKHEDPIHRKVRFPLCRGKKMWLVKMASQRGNMTRFLR